MPSRQFNDFLQKGNRKKALVARPAIAAAAATALSRFFCFNFSFMLSNLPPMLSALGRVSEVPVPKFEVEEQTLTFPELMTTGAQCNSGPQGAGLVTNSFFNFYQPRSSRSTFDVGQKKEEKEKKTVTLAFFAIFASVPGIFLTGPIIWVSMALLDPSNPI